MRVIDADEVSMDVGVEVRFVEDVGVNMTRLHVRRATVLSCFSSIIAGARSSVTVRRAVEFRSRPWCYPSGSRMGCEEAGTVFLVDAEGIEVVENVTPDTSLLVVRLTEGFAEAGSSVSAITDVYTRMGRFQVDVSRVLSLDFFLIAVVVMGLGYRRLN